MVDDIDRNYKKLTIELDKTEGGRINVEFEGLISQGDLRRMMKVASKQLLVYRRKLAKELKLEEPQGEEPTDEESDKPKTKAKGSKK